MGEDIHGDLTQSAVLLFQAIQLLLLDCRRSLSLPALELAVVDIDELQLFSVHALDPVDRGVVERVRSSFCFGEGLKCGPGYR